MKFVIREDEYGNEIKPPWFWAGLFGLIVIFAVFTMILGIW